MNTEERRERQLTVGVVCFILGVVFAVTFRFATNTPPTLTKTNFYCDSQGHVKFGLEELVTASTGEIGWCFRPPQEQLLQRPVCACAKWGEAAFSRQIVCISEGKCTPTNVWMTDTDYWSLYPKRRSRSDRDLWPPP